MKPSTAFGVAGYGTALAALLAVLASAARAEPVDVFASTVPLNEDAPGQVRVGALEYTGGLVLSSPDKHFGGWSGMLVDVDGRAIDAVSDKGRRLRLALTWDHRGHLSGVADATLTPLHDEDGDRLKKKKHSDAESLARDASGDVLVSFERRHRIDAYAAPGAPARPLPPPPHFPLMPKNGGVEALTRLSDGRLLALSEGFQTSLGYMGWLGTPAPGGIWNWETLTYPNDAIHAPTGAATLPNGDVLVVARRYSVLAGVGAQVRRIPAVQMVPGSQLDGDLLADLGPPLTVDNFEAISVFTDGQGAVRVLLLSDDNFSPLQRTVLLSFRLVE